jgi:hypothetical protein
VTTVIPCIGLPAESSSIVWIGRDPAPHTDIPENAPVGRISMLSRYADGLAGIPAHASGNVFVAPAVIVVFTARQGAMGL